MFTVQLTHLQYYLGQLSVTLGADTGRSDRPSHHVNSVFGDVMSDRSLAISLTITSKPRRVFNLYPLPNALQINRTMFNAGITKNSRPKRKNRPRPLPPDVTARNLAIEKQRRGELKEDFLVRPPVMKISRYHLVTLLRCSIRNWRACCPTLPILDDLQRFSS